MVEMSEVGKSQRLRHRFPMRAVFCSEVRLPGGVHLRGVADVVAPFWPVAASRKPVGRKHGESKVRA